MAEIILPDNAKTRISVSFVSVWRLLPPNHAERLSPAIALSFLPFTNTWAARLALSVWALPAAAERYVFGRPDILSSSAGSTSRIGELGDDLNLG
jgi:hypothetical protein